MQLHRFYDGVAGPVQNIAQSFADWQKANGGKVLPWAPDGHSLLAGYWPYELPDGNVIGVRPSHADIQAHTKGFV